MKQTLIIAAVLIGLASCQKETTEPDINLAAELKKGEWYHGAIHCNFINDSVYLTTCDEPFIRGTEYYSLKGDTFTNYQLNPDSTKSRFWVLTNLRYKTDTVTFNNNGRFGIFLIRRK